MQLRIPARPAAVLEQRRVVGGDPLKEGPAGALDLGVARGSVPEEGPIVDKGADQVEDQLEIDVVAEVAPREGRSEGPP
jgi:hypothetical protein